MINRENWKLTKAYLEYREKIDQIASGSLRTETTYIRYLLEWAESVPFRKAHKIRPAFQEYLLSVRLDGSHEQLSPSFTKKILAAARNFFIWCSDNYSGFQLIKRAWINALKPRRIPAPPKKDEAVSLD